VSLSPAQRDPREAPAGLSPGSNGQGKGASFLPTIMSKKER